MEKNESVQTPPSFSPDSRYSPFHKSDSSLSISGNEAQSTISEHLTSEELKSSIEVQVQKDTPELPFDSELAKFGNLNIMEEKIDRKLEEIMNKLSMQRDEIIRRYWQEYRLNSTKSYASMMELCSLW
ncbi:hypothetical protein DdX_05461 [Ditylenchus destructor]|uniref:Uncharacterized protein n=1 Tax=Ditylenchus destructor TaxID=166010 RepID=A0AAD4N7M9_9BILA|nr:hypothetical protein DdX_05461 [Ditylenchus destructor]